MFDDQLTRLAYIYVCKHHYKLFKKVYDIYTTKEVYKGDLIEDIEGIFGLSNERTIFVISAFEYNFDVEIRNKYHHFFGIDAEAELTTMLSEHLTAQIDREILESIRNAQVGSWVVQTGPTPTPEINTKTQVAHELRVARNFYNDETRNPRDG